MRGRARSRSSSSITHVPTYSLRPTCHCPWIYLDLFGSIYDGAISLGAGTDAPLRMPTPPPVAAPWGPPHAYAAPTSYKGQQLEMRRLAEMDVLAVRTDCLFCDAMLVLRSGMFVKAGSG